MFCGPSMVFTNVVNPRSHVSPQARVPAHARAARRVASAPTRPSSAARRSASTPSSAPARWSRSDVPAYALMAGVPARRIGWMCQCGERLPREAVEAGCASAVPAGREYVARRRRAFARLPGEARMTHASREPLPHRARRLRADQQQPPRRRSRGRRAGAGGGVRHDRRARARPAARAARRALVPRPSTTMLATCRVRRRGDLHARPGCIRRTASSRRARAGTSSPRSRWRLARGCRRAGAGVRRRRRAAVRREAEPAQSADPAAQARDRQGALRPHLHGQHAPCAGRARRSTTTRRRGAARGSSTAARS